MSLLENIGPLRVEIRETEEGYSLFRDGKTFFVKGAAGYQYVKELAEAGGNSLRTWGFDQTTIALPEIRRHGLTLCAGLWMVPPRQGFDYADSAACEIQFDELKKQVLSLASESSLLVWGVGNELELGVANLGPEVWMEVERVAAFIKETDALRPVMTVLASVDEVSLRSIQEHCPSIDFVSFNSYGDLESVQAKLDRIGWDRPYLVTEWGANGHWEVSSTTWGAEVEPTSTEKAEQIRRRYRSLNGTHGKCLGSYVFLWGQKQETTPTWYGLFDSKGRSTESVEAIGAAWKTESESANSVKLSPIKVNGYSAQESLVVEPGSEISASFKVLGGTPHLENVRWSVAHESSDKKEGGDAEAKAPQLDINVKLDFVEEASFAAPLEKGNYRLYLEVTGLSNSVATANFPFKVE